MMDEDVRTSQKCLSLSVLGLGALMEMEMNPGIMSLK